MYIIEIIGKYFEVIFSDVVWELMLILGIVIISFNKLEKKGYIECKWLSIDCWVVYLSFIKRGRLLDWLYSKFYKFMVFYIIEDLGEEDIKMLMSVLGNFYKFLEDLV